MFVRYIDEVKIDAHYFLVSGKGYSRFVFLISQEGFQSVVDTVLKGLCGVRAGRKDRFVINTEDLVIGVDQSVSDTRKFLVEPNFFLAQVVAANAPSLIIYRLHLALRVG